MGARGAGDYAIAPARMLEHGKRVGYDIYRVTAPPDAVPTALWLTYMGWSRTLDGARQQIANAIRGEGR